MKGFMEETIFMLVEVILIVIFTILLVRSVGASFNPDKEVAVLNTELLRSKINEACLTRQPVTMDKFSLTQPKPSKVLGVTDFLPSFAISGSGASDPHYVLYYEQFPAGEGIGWEIYNRFDTRYIAPFDYSKTKEGEGKLVKKGDSITGGDVENFLKSMDSYREEVLNNVQKFEVVEIGEGNKTILTAVGYFPAEDGMPQEPKWVVTGGTPITNMLEGTVCIADALAAEPECRRNDHLEDTLKLSNRRNYGVIFKHSETSPSETSYIEAELQIVENKDQCQNVRENLRNNCLSVDPEISVSIQNKPYQADLFFREDRIILSAKNTKEYAINTKDKIHKYKLEIKGNQVAVYVNPDVSSGPVITDTAKETGTENAFLWGAGNVNDPRAQFIEETKSYWKSVVYAGSSVELPEEEEAEAYKLAQKPVLINNIILSDHLNVIPTEQPKPPVSEVTKSASDIGSAGQWIGDRFEFSDYFGITKEERAYIKYEPCGDNALCLKTRDAVQRFPLDSRCSNAAYIQMEYDARDLDWEDLVPAMWVVGDVAALKTLSGLKISFQKTALSTVPDTARKLAPTAIEGMDDEYLKALDTEMETVVKKPGLLSRTLKKLGSFGKGILKTGGKKTLGSLPGKLKLAGQLYLLSDLFLGHGKDAVENLLKASLAYRSSEFYIASPCQLTDGKITIQYVQDCQKECETGISYPLYEYNVDYDGTKTITNAGEHFACLGSIGKDKDEPKDVEGDIACIKITMDDVKRRDFCWTNNPILPEEKSIWGKLKNFVPGVDDILSGAISCGVGLAFGGPLGCLGGIATDVAINTAGDTLDALGITQGGLKGEAFTRMGALPVTETTSYIEDGNIRAVQMDPTSIGGNALKRLGEVAANYVNIDWAWPG